MSRLIYRTGLPLAFFAAMILTLPACSGGAEELWQTETIVEEKPLEAPRFRETFAAGKLTLTATQKVSARKTPVERLYMVYTDTWSDFDWDSFGLTFFAILGGVLSIGLYFLVAFVLVDPPTDENK